MKITAIIPLRITDHVYQAHERLRRIISNIPSDLFSILVVDYGTPASHRAVFDALPNETKVVHYPSEKSVFSIGHARDLGVQHADNPVVMFHDIDFFGTPAMYKRIHAEATARQIDTNAYDFFCVPVFFLTQQGSDLALDLAKDEVTADLKLHRQIFESAPGIVEFPAYGSSAIVVNKHHYLGIGGHSREFFGHGAEDYDVLHRLAAYAPKGPRTAHYYLDTKSNAITDYKGFRAYFALYGIDIFARGIFFVHLWHPKRIIPGYHQSNRNFALLTDLMTRFDKARHQPAPLGDASTKIRTLILISPDTSSFRAIRHAIPCMGSYEAMHENNFADGSDIVKYCKIHGFQRVLLLNPYGNELRLDIYRKLREEKFPSLVFDRGALPDSWFFDPNGFNFDSLTYQPEFWDQDISDTAQHLVEEYIFNLRNSSKSLEKNGDRKSGRYWRDKYAIGPRKVLFVPFQRPSDTVTNHFAGASESVFGFQEWVRFVIEKLPRSEWVVICKNHPLDPDLPRIDGAIYADDSTHIHDLLELADKVLLMNSGVGVLAQIFDKPVICASQAFYCHDGIAFSAQSAEHALELVKNNLSLDTQRIRRFIHHLISSVYSFGETQYRQTVAADGSARRIAEDIRFDAVRILKNGAWPLGSAPKGITLDAPLFQSFGGRIGVKTCLDNAKPITGKKPAQPPNGKPASGVKGGTAPAANKPAPTAPTPSGPTPAKPVRMPTPDTTPTPSGPTPAKPVRMPTPETTPSPQFNRKFRKLVNNPGLFFQDMLLKRKSTIN